MPQAPLPASRHMQPRLLAPLLAWLPSQLLRRPPQRLSSERGTTVAPRPGNRLAGPVLLGLVATLAACAQVPPAPPAAAVPAGEVKGSAASHTPASARQLVANAQLALPAAGGQAAFFGKWADAPTGAGNRFPVVVFLHGSSGLGLAAIGQWQQWLASLGMASVAPDSFALPDRLTYKSPVDKAVYERIHSLRAEEIRLTLDAVRQAPWAAPRAPVLAGTSEGAVAVARYGGTDVAGRMVFAWSCEDNYMVQAHRTAVVAGQPLLNVISTVDPFFSQTNTYLGAHGASGHCGGVFAKEAAATIVLVGNAPHTLLNLPATRHATQGFLADVFKH